MQRLRMWPENFRGELVVVLLLAIAFYLSGLAAKPHWCCTTYQVEWEAIVASVAVLVALSIGIREALQSGRERDERTARLNAARDMVQSLAISELQEVAASVMRVKDNLPRKQMGLEEWIVFDAMAIVHDDEAMNRLKGATQLLVTPVLDSLVEKLDVLSRPDLLALSGILRLMAKIKRTPYEIDRLMSMGSRERGNAPDVADKMVEDCDLLLDRLHRLRETWEVGLQGDAPGHPSTAPIVA